MRICSLLVGVSLLFACGDEAPDGFTACGGELVGSGAASRVWDFAGVTLSGAACGTEAAALMGFVSFNAAMGRYSVNGKGVGWMLAGSAECGFNTNYGGFFKSEGSKVCFAETEADLAASPCDESGFDASARPRSAGADYCVAGNALELSTHTFLGLVGGGVIKAQRAP